MDDFKTNLAQLNKLNEYYNYLESFDKNDNLTNIKKFYNTYIFISIVDFNNGNYRLFANRRDFRDYLRKNAAKKMKQQYDVQIEACKAEKLKACVNQEKANDLDNLLIGSISFETMEDPVVTPAGHLYDRQHISHWIHHNHTDPFTRESLSRRHLNPIRCIKDLVQKYNKPMEMEMEMDVSLEEEKEEKEEEEEILSLEEQIQACKRAAVAFKRMGRMDAARSEVKKYHSLREQLELEWE